MFPRVLGYLAGRAVRGIAQFCHRALTEEPDSGQNRSIDRYVPAALAIAGISVLPPPLRVPTVFVWSLPYVIPFLREQLAGQESERIGASTRRGLACFYQILVESDPMRLSPYGTMPLDQCRPE